MMLFDHPLLDAALSLALALALPLPLGWDREHRSRSFGLRTYPLIAVATCAFILLARSGLAADVEQQSDVFYGLLSGMAIFGSGAMLPDAKNSRGMSTAISLWVTGAIGISVGYGVPQIAAALCLLSLVALRLPAPAHRKGTSP